ncbi:MAG: hypothetical protein Q7U47_09170 [Paludibacter sp.]|nr:hypothetical protein [Paludibacter sp.]
MLLISSCTEGFFDNLTGTSTETTGAMFWTASDLGVGSITVTCNGSTKTISSYYSSGDPNHGASGAANFTLNPGNYSYNASGGSLKWSGNIDVTKGVCTKMQLYGNSTGTGSLSLNGKWKDSVEFTIIISGTSGLINSFGSGNWKTAAEKGYVQIGSLFLKSISKSNSTNWTCENLAMTTTNGVINGTKWYSNSTITISTNGNSFTLYTTIGTNTFTRVN